MRLWDMTAAPIHFKFEQQKIIHATKFILGVENCFYKIITDM